mgnify:CR=1 FL=1
MKSHSYHKHDLIYYILIYIFFNGTEGVICPILLSIFCHKDAVFMPFVQETAGRERLTNRIAWRIISSLEQKSLSTSERKHSMLCQNCGRNEATTHIKRIVDGESSELHLCSGCAQHLGYSGMFWGFGSNIGTMSATVWDILGN